MEYNSKKTMHMIEIYLIAKGDINTKTCETPTLCYESLEDFINNFPYSERQCIIQAEREINRNGFFIFGDSEDRVRYKLVPVNRSENAKQY